MTYAGGIGLSSLGTPVAEGRSLPHASPPTEARNGHAHSLQCPLHHTFEQKPCSFSCSQRAIVVDLRVGELSCTGQLGQLEWSYGLPKCNDWTRTPGLRSWCSAGSPKTKWRAPRSRGRSHARLGWCVCS
ncbi:hypothetical protein BU23DRAFT_962 [Bimuria novae-zelandiae CBS 107.79]|uniref:Uncharacterized protein n=1 Tax=Bimuria novae-zelandiae CBS 107.79 TaxID=1447943 RepID=A0A6A5VWA9_9PLEO|nr:hypothetical protein BU23DRAFT_962 [Bimuria novae-zelandiae CBS 107.79]